MKKKQRFTKAQLEDWSNYEEVRAGGAYNMFDPRARATAGLSRDEYMFVMNHYSEIKAQIEHDFQSSRAKP